MKAESIAKISAVVCVIVSILLVAFYIITLDRPLGEGYKRASDYGGEFVLKSDKGEVALSDFKDKVVVIYFGFMNCQDACPVSIIKMRTAFNRLSKEELEKVQGVFISIDPARDTPEELAAFLHNYHEKIIGLVDNPDTINQLLRQYGVYAKPEDYDGKSTTYTVDHSSRFYMIDKNGKLVTTLSHSTTPAELVAKIRNMLAG